MNIFPDIFCHNTNDGVSVLQYPLVILVGVTGTGKSTGLELLTESFDKNVVLIPERRILTDHFILRPLMREQGLAERTLTREERYPYLKQFRKDHPEGVAGILRQLALKKPLESDQFLVFDGLRGLNEIDYALENFSNCHFLAFDTPYSVRILRLLERRDSHDNFIRENKSLDSVESILKKISNRLSKEELDSFKEAILSNKYHLDDLSHKVEVIEREELLYTPKSSLKRLQENKNNTFCIVDTHLHSLDEEKSMIKNFINKILVK